MPGFNELGRGKLGIGVEKLLGIAAPGALRSMSPELSAVMQLPISEEELMGISGWGRWSSGFTIPALPAGFNRWQIRNPVNSGVIVFLERVTCGGGATGLFAADGGYATTTDLLNSPTSDFRDGRTNPRSGGAAVVTWEQAVGALTPTAGRLVAIANTMVEFPFLPVILMPGNAYLFGYSVVNTESYANVVWRERGATPAELKPA